MNKSLLIGRLGKDPAMSYTQSGQAVANLSIATDESYKDKSGQKVEKAEWHRVVVFGKQAEFCGQYLTKGRLVFVEGRLQTRKWQDQNGQDRYQTEIVAQDIRVLDKGQNQPQGASGGQGQGQGRPAGQNASTGQNGANRGHEDDLGPAFPSDSGGMSDVPF